MNAMRVFHMACTALLGALAATTALDAQPVELIPHLSGTGTAMALQQARASLGADAALVFIGAMGNSSYDANGFTVQLRFNLDDGTSTAWAYAFYSAAKNQRVVLAVVDVPGTGFQVMPAAAPVPIPAVRTPLDTALPYAGSERMIERLAGDSVYRRYRAELPGALPYALAFRPLSAADSAVLPTWFPLDAPVWAMRFTGAGDSAMVCYVAGATGATYCTHSAVASAPRNPGRPRNPDRPLKLELTHGNRE